MTAANGHGEALWMGPPDALQTSGPCIGCGQPTTRHVITALGLTPRKGAFTAETPALHESCELRAFIARAERRLMDVDVHPEARARLVEQIAWAQARVHDVERQERGLPPAA